jgi:urease accessory protein
MQPQLAVSFARDAAGRTFLAQQRSTHPFHLCKLLYRPDDPPGLATLYVQGCSGGLFEHDRWAVEVCIRAGARAHVTTAAATLVHRMPHGGSAAQTLHLRLEPEGLLEYYPDPLILFSGSRLTCRTVIALSPGARLIAIDSFLPHRLPGDGTPFDFLDSELRVSDARGTLLARERYRVQGHVLCEGVPGVTGTFGCQGSVLVLGAGAAPLGAIRGALEGQAGARGGASLLPDESGVIARILGRDGASLRAALVRVWAAARATLGIEPAHERPK